MGKFGSLASQALARIGKDWSKASLTREKLLGNVRAFAGHVQKTYGLERIEQLKPKHIENYVNSLRERGLAASTLAGKMTAVREVCKSIGKANIVDKANGHYGIARVRVNPQPVNDVRLHEIRQAITERADGGDKVAMMVRAADALRVEFGLRSKESLLSSKIEIRGGKHFLAVEGAKGGRPRELEARTEGQLRAIQVVSETAKAFGSCTGRIIPPQMTLAQAYNAQRNLWRQLGGTRAVGANMHGERHAYARGRSAEGVAHQQLMGELGHGEDRSPAAYLGPSK